MILSEGWGKKSGIKEYKRQDEESDPGQCIVFISYENMDTYY